MEQATFWDRLAARTKPSGALVSIENPKTIVWMAFSWTLGSVLLTWPRKARWPYRLAPAEA